jgi:hypothetical protein
MGGYGPFSGPAYKQIGGWSRLSSAVEHLSTRSTQTITILPTSHWPSIDHTSTNIPPPI